MSKIEKLRSKQTGLKNDALEAEMRPGREAVVIRRERLDYYQKLEGMLEEALDAASENQAPIITVRPEDIRAEVEKALSHVAGQVEGIVANTLARLTGISAAPAAGQLPAEITAGTPPEAVDRKKHKLSSPESEPGWLTVPDLARKHGLRQWETNNLYYAINKGRIKAKGQGRGRTVSEASYLVWKAGRV